MRLVTSRTVLILAIVAVAIAAPARGAADAQGSPVLVSNAYPLASEEPLAIAGSATLVAVAGRTHNAIVLFAPGRKPITVARPHPIGEDAGRTELAASPTRIAVLQHGYFAGYKGCCATFTQSVLAAPFGGPLHEQLTGCRVAPGLDESVTGEAGIQAHYAFALDGDVLAYDSFGCVVVEDLASGSSRVIRLEATLDPVRQHVVFQEPTVLAVAGRLVAYRANGLGGEGPAAIVVYNIDTGRELYRVPVPPPEPEAGTSFALQADGTLVVARRCSASVSSVSEPAPRPLGVAACAIDGLAADHVLLVARGIRGHELLGWTTLQTPQLHVMSDLGPGAVLGAASPVLGTTEVVYALEGCWAPAVYRTTLNEPGTPPRPPATCPLAVAANHATVSTRGLTVPIRCPLGCKRVELAAHVGLARELHREEGGTPLTGLGFIESAPRRTTTLRILPDESEPEESRALVKRLIGQLRYHRRLYLRVDLYTPTPAGAGAGSTSRAQELGLRYATHTHAVLPLRLASISHGH
jgi:hypothetical protein